MVRGSDGATSRKSWKTCVGGGLLAAALAAVCLLLVIAVKPAHADMFYGEIYELAGGDRYETANAINYEGFYGVGTVIVARGDNFPDALAASSLASVLDAAIVLTDPYQLSPASRETIERLGPSDAVVLGGVDSVSNGVYNELVAMGLDCYRVYGDSRTQTAVEIYNFIDPAYWGDTAIITNGFKPWDALSISPYAHATCSPIFLTEADGEISFDTLMAISTGGFDRVIVLGGTDSVSESVQVAFNAKRIAGVNRYQTSAMIADMAVSEGVLSYDNVTISTGRNFPDALAASPVISFKNGVLLLADGEGYWDAATTVLNNRSRIGEICFLGNFNAVNQYVRDQIVSAVYGEWQWAATNNKYQALYAAQNHMYTCTTSRTELIRTLYYNGYSYADSLFAADSLGQDWYDEALYSARAFLDFVPYSYKGLVEALVHNGFTNEQAQYGVTKYNVNWNAQAEWRAWNLFNSGVSSRDEMYYELFNVSGFTHDQAMYGINAVGL